MYLIVCIICMLVSGFLVASAEIKSDRDGVAFNIFDSKFILVILGIGVFFGIGAFGVDKMDFWAVLIVAVVSFIVGLVGRFMLKSKE